MRLRTAFLAAGIAVMAYSVAIPAAADELTNTITRALDARLTLYRTPSGRTMYVRHCRSAPGGCHARVAQLAGWIVEVSREHQVDPWLLAAMAVRESGLNPFAVGRAGGRGIVQIHPPGTAARGQRRASFLRSEGYRQRCAREPGACQREILEAGARHLAEWLRRCGSVPES